LESIYENAMKVALCQRGLALIVQGEIVVELKAIRTLEDVHFAQVRSYLKATGLRVGLLLNFNAPTLVIKRIVL
jgi:GxxExxY protein